MSIHTTSRKRKVHPEETIQIRIDVERNIAELFEFLIKDKKLCKRKILEKFMRDWVGENGGN